MRRKTTVTTFWKIESRWLSGNWLSRPMKLKFKFTVGEAQKQPDLHCKIQERLRKWQQVVPLKVGTQLKLIQDLLIVYFRGGLFTPLGEDCRQTL